MRGESLRRVRATVTRPVSRHHVAGLLVGALVLSSAVAACTSADGQTSADTGDASTTTTTSVTPVAP